MSNCLLYQHIGQSLEIMTSIGIFITTSFLLKRSIYVTNKIEIEIFQFTSTKSWKRSFSLRQALAIQAAFSEHPIRLFINCRIFIFWEKPYRSHWESWLFTYLRYEDSFYFWTLGDSSSLFLVHREDKLIPSLDVNLNQMEFSICDLRVKNWK